MGILDVLQALGPIITQASAASAKNQDVNTALGTNIAASRPNIVGKNLSNSMKASLLGPGYQSPTQNWGGPGSVARGQMVTHSGGPGPMDPQTSELQKLVESDALTQAKGNYGLSDPAASSTLDKVEGGAGTALSVLGALAKLKPGGGPGPSSGPAGGPGSPGTFGKGPLDPGTPATPGTTGTPFDISQQGPNDVRAYGSDEIEQLLRILGSGGFGSAKEPGFAGGSAGETGYF